MNNFLADIMLTMDSYKNLISDVKKKKSVISLNGIIEEGLGHFLYSVDFHMPGEKIFITYSEQRGKKVYEDLKNLGLEDVYFFPKKEDFFYNSIARSLDSSNDQIKALWAMIHKSPIIITTAEACLDKLVTKDNFDLNSFIIEFSDIIEIGELSKRLIKSGYENVPTVEGKGQFSVRGGIIDIFPPISENPYRIELFGDEIDSIRIFDPISQRSIENVEYVEVSPAIQNVLDGEDRNRVIESLEKELNETKIKDSEILRKLNEKFGNLIGKLKDKLYVKNTDLLIPYINENNLNSLLDYIDTETLVFVDEPRRIEEGIAEKYKDFKTRFSDLLISGEVLYSHENSFFNYDDVVKKISKNTKITFSNILRDNQYFKPESILNFRMKSTTSYNGRMEIFKEEIERYLYRGFKIAILVGDKQRANRLSESLHDLNINTKVLDSLDTKISSNEILIHDSSISNGFEYSDIKFSIINYREIYGNSRKKEKKKKKSAKGITDFADIQIGDFVVHENHGVGVYKGTEQIELQGNKRDFILIQYGGADRLYIPTDQLGLIHKYVGVGDTKPKVHKLNSVEWSKTKIKAKRAIDDMADELIELYAAREAKEGYMFSPDTLWQNQFEDAFPYQETEGQLSATREIKDDMEKKTPMDRLLCADVGYGKTEVALRAAFKAVMDGKQVAFLVPTTILAQQHYNTMMERFRDFPVKIALFSRFRTKTQINEDIKALRKGQVDIVIGTHRILSKDIKFKDLGLLIIDEEQRFGVRHKETLKMLKENVDNLTLTATPIPRTLQMSMIGIRNMSVIDEPPEERFPIQTYVAEFNTSMIREAILREIDRDGQVYFLYNRVSDIESMAGKIQEIVPEAKVSIAHGQMSERVLEDSMMSFLNKESDVLVCTTIIETGLDIPNVNTIIINDADRFGLSQLYQLRGRVGRSNRIAYAYFTYDPNKQLSEVSEKRLMAIKEYTEFGSGFKIAMRDLEIRGAGNILSSQQHGHIDNIGYDLYLSFLENAMKKLKGEEVKDINETSIDINIEAYIPESYIKDHNQRLEFYKKISVIESDEDYSELIEEAIDRYGDIPEATNNLMDISQIKFLANEKNIENISGNENKLKIKFNEDKDIDIASLNQVISNFGNKIQFNLKGEKSLEFKPGKYPLVELKDLIENII